MRKLESRRFFLGIAVLLMIVGLATSPTGVVLADAATSRVRVMLQDDVSTAGVALELLDRDDSRLMSDGYIAFTFRVKNVSTIMILVDGVIIETRTLLLSDDWQEGTILLHLGAPGEHNVVIRVVADNVIGSIDRAFAVRSEIDSQHGGGGDVREGVVVSRGRGLLGVMEGVASGPISGSGDYGGNTELLPEAEGAKNSGVIIMKGDIVYRELLAPLVAAIFSVSVLWWIIFAVVRQRGRDSGEGSDGSN